MKLLMPLVAALLATQLVAQSIDALPVNSGADSIRGSGDVGVIPGTVMPVAHADKYEVVDGKQLVVDAPGLLDNDTGNGLIAYTEDGVDGGRFQVNADGSFTFEPAPGIVGFEMFSYLIVDAAGNVDKGSVYFWYGDSDVEGESGSSSFEAFSISMPASEPEAADEAASCSATSRGMPWLLMPLMGLAAMRFRRARA